MGAKYANAGKKALDETAIEALAKEMHRSVSEIKHHHGAGVFTTERRGARSRFS
jgi:hypothetical protein